MAIVVLVVTIIAVLLIWFVTFNPKLRAKIMGRQIKSMKYMLDENEEMLTELSKKGANINIKSKKHILDENEEMLTELSKKGANISKEGIKITASALKEGLTGNQVYCKYCGKSIEEDSVFCKNCGKKQ